MKKEKIKRDIEVHWLNSRKARKKVNEIFINLAENLFWGCAMGFW